MYIFYKFDPEIQSNCLLFFCTFYLFVFIISTFEVMRGLYRETCTCVYILNNHHGNIILKLSLFFQSSFPSNGVVIAHFVFTSEKLVKLVPELGARQTVEKEMNSVVHVLQYVDQGPPERVPSDVVNRRIPLRKPVLFSNQNDLYR